MGELDSLMFLQLLICHEWEVIEWSSLGPQFLSLKRCPLNELVSVSVCQI